MRIRSILLPYLPFFLYSISLFANGQSSIPRTSSTLSKNSLDTNSVGLNLALSNFYEISKKNQSKEIDPIKSNRTDIKIPRPPVEDGSPDLFSSYKVDAILCVIVLLLVTFFSFVLAAREVFFVKKSHSLRTIIMLMAFLNGLLLITYTVLARLFSDKWDDWADCIGDLLCTLVALIQFYLVIAWLVYVSWGLDESDQPVTIYGLFNIRNKLVGDSCSSGTGSEYRVSLEFHTVSDGLASPGVSVSSNTFGSISSYSPFATMASSWKREPIMCSCPNVEQGEHASGCGASISSMQSTSTSSSMFRYCPSKLKLYALISPLVLIILYVIVGLILIIEGQYAVFNAYQDAITLIACISYLFIGTYFLFQAHHRTNLLNISIETYTVLERLKSTTGYLLISCAIFAIILASLSLFGPEPLATYVNVMETKYYICHRISCLVTFLIRVVFIVSLPNWAISFTFSSPEDSGDAAFLRPVNRSASKYFASSSAFDFPSGARSLASSRKSSLLMEDEKNNAVPSSDLSMDSGAIPEETLRLLQNNYI